MLNVRTGARQLPARYAEPWREAFDTRVTASLLPGVRILDVGSGRAPTIPVGQRPDGCFYAGLDLSQEELDLAPAGSYDESFVSDVVRHTPELEGQFDLIVSWQVLEHVKPLSDALENMRSYLRPGGRMVAQLSGGLSAFGLINKAVPAKAGVWAMHRLLGRDPSSVFPAYYDHCTYSALEKITTQWSDAEIVPRYRGGSYFGWMRPLQVAYLQYENWASTRYPNLATHYLIVGTK